MNRNLTKSIAITCGLALTLSTIAATSFARGSGHSSRGHVSRSFSSRNASFNRNNFRFNNRFNNFRSPYYGWGYYSPYSYNYGWGWGCYGNSYNSYGYNSYGNTSYGNNSYGNSYAGSPGTNPAGAPSMPVPPDQNAAAQPGGQPAPGDMAPPAGQPGPLAAGQPADQATPAIASATAGPADKTSANNEEAVAEEAAPTAAATPNAGGKPTDAVKPVDAAKPTEAKPVVPHAPADSLVGTFKASPAPGVQIEVTMRADTTFTWKFTAEGKTQTFSGLYEIGPNSLALTRDGGDKMDGTLERVGSGFKFRMKGAEAQDPGLTFTR
jgi:hypothetical protein